MRILTILLGLIVFSALGAGEAAAYIDPGTGSVIFGAIGYVIAAGAAFIAIAVKPVKMLYNRFIKRKRADSAVEGEGDDNSLKDNAEL